MHQLFALAIFLLLTVGKPTGAFVTTQQQVAYTLGGVAARVVAFMALQVIVYFGAKLARPQEAYASFTATRLNWLTLGILVFAVAAQMKH